jgi:hypothetical protein
MILKIAKVFILKIRADELNKKTERPGGGK